MPSQTSLLFEVGDISIPILVSQENRRNVRISFTKDSVNLRLPRYFSAGAINVHINKAKDWIARNIEINPSLKDRFRSFTFKLDDTITVFDKHLRIVERNYLHDKVLVKINLLDISLSAPHYSNKDRGYISSAIQKALSRTIAKRLRLEFEQMVYETNAKTLAADFSKITLKFNSSNWGSCSSKSNLNFSTRLLFAPSDTIRYVIIHELCHLYEMNHSQRFWNLVAQHCPDYKKHEMWLKHNSSSCNFVPDRYKSGI